MIIIRKCRKIFLCLVFIFILAINNVYADSYIKVDTDEIQKNYQDYWSEQNEKETNFNSRPFNYTVNLEKEKNEYFLAFQTIIRSVNEVINLIPSSFDLREKMYIEVKNQQDTRNCWTFASLTSMETNLKLKYGTSLDFSERHMDFSTSQNFYDSENPKGFNRMSENGGSAIIAMAYLTNGQGVVLEEQMPFENNIDRISINDIEIPPSYYVKEYESFPTIYKYKDENGNLVYFDGISNYYTEEQIKKNRNKIKEHIMNYGAILSYTYVGDSKYYNNSNIMDATCYYCDNINTNVDHAVAIIGWDDNYSKDNFTGDTKPSQNGAYLILNSYSKDAFDDGCLWISYEDAWIEAMLYGITESSEIDYDNLYQNDWFGPNVPIMLGVDNSSVKEGYYSSIYDRNLTDKLEFLTKVAVSTNQSAKLEIYVNPSGDSIIPENLVKVATTEVLNSGYNTIEIKPILLTGKKFAVVVKHIAQDDNFYMMIESQIDNTFYDSASANPRI